MDERRVGAGTLSLAALAHLRDAVAPLDGLLTAGIGHEHDRRRLRLGARRALGLGRRGRRLGHRRSRRIRSSRRRARLGRRRAEIGRWRLGLCGRSRAAAGGERRAGEKRHQRGEEAARAASSPWTIAPPRWFRLTRATLCLQAGWPRAAWRSEESPDTEGQGRWGNPRRRKPTESGTESRPPAGASPEAPAGKGETVG